MRELRELCERLKVTLVGAGWPTTWQDTGYGRATLKVLGCDIRLQVNSRRVLYMMNNRFLWGARRGWDAERMLTLIISVLPELLKRKQAQENTQYARDQAEQLKEAHKGDDRLRIAHYANEFHIIFRTPDFMVTALACDKVQELDVWSTEVETTTKSSGPRRYVLVDDDNVPVGESKCLAEVIAMPNHSATPDQLADMVPGELLIDGDIRLMRL